MARRPAPAGLLYVSAGSRDRAQGIAFVCSCETRDSVTPAPRRSRIASAPRSSRASRRASRARGDRRSPRPAPAIRAGATDGNSKTEGDVNFATLLPTPCFPSHPSKSRQRQQCRRRNGATDLWRRGAFDYAVSRDRRDWPGIVELHLVEAANQRRGRRPDHGGLHFRFDQQAGARLGNDVATYVYKNNLQPIHGSN